jgi:hypothetical protein
MVISVRLMEISSIYCIPGMVAGLLESGDKYEDQSPGVPLSLWRFGQAPFIALVAFVMVAKAAKNNFCAGGNPTGVSCQRFMASASATSEPIR